MERHRCAKERGGCAMKRSRRTSQRRGRVMERSRETMKRRHRALSGYGGRLWTAETYRQLDGSTISGGRLILVQGDPGLPLR